MMTYQITPDAVTAAHGAKTLLRHTATAPFAAVIKDGTALPLTEIIPQGENTALLRAGELALALAFEPSATDHDALTLTLQPNAAAARCGFRFRLPAVQGEAVFGGGEQYRQLNLAGQTVQNVVVEHITWQTVFQKAVLPLGIYREKPHGKIGSYAPMPLFTTSGHELIYFDTAAQGKTVFGANEYAFTFEECPKTLQLVQKRDFAALGTWLAGQIPNRQYIPDWCHDGMILGAQGGTEEVLAKVGKMQAAGAKICGVWCQDWCGEKITAMGKQVWWNWQVDDTLYPGLKDAIAALRGKGVRFLGYINPYLVKDGAQYNECKAKGYLILRQDGTVYHIKSTTFDAGMLDLTNPAVQHYIKTTLIRKNMLDLGIVGWMADFGEYLPMDCVLHDGNPAALHNLWPVLWAKLNREAVDEFNAEQAEKQNSAGQNTDSQKDEAFFFTRSGYLGVQSYAPIMWNGDQHTDASHDYGLPCVLPASFSLGFSGVTLVHCDLGGFFSIGRMKRSAELTARWAELCAFSVLMRSHEAIRPWCNAQPYDDAVLPYAVKMSKIHAALKPYLQHCVEQARQGIPALRPDFYTAERYTPAQQSQQTENEYTYLLGDDLFIAPVLAEKITTRTVTLPVGEWCGVFDGNPYTGGATVTVAAPLGKPAVFYRTGSEFAPLFAGLKEL